MQLDHFNLFVADVARSCAFYQPLLEPLGFRVNRDFGEIAIGLGDANYAVLALVRTRRAIEPMHFAFRVPERSEVDAFHQRALSLGALCNGPPGLRPHYHAHYYAAYVLDPDGHNVELVCHEAVT